jgi:hypothetical protein
MWEGKNCHGILSFTDKDNWLENLPLSIGGFVDISFISQPNTQSGEPAPFDKKFVITSVKSFDGDVRSSTKIVEIRFEAFENKILKSTYESVVYNDQEPSKSLEEQFNRMGINLIVAADEEEKKTTLITPSHISMDEYLDNEMDYRGYHYIQDRHSSYLVHDSHMTNEKAQPTGEFFEYKPADISSRAQVIEYITDGFDITALENSIPSSTNEINNENTQQEEMSVKTKMTAPTGGSVGNGIKATDMHVVNGEKQQTSYNQSSATLSKELKNLQKMSIWVPGWNGNRLGMSVEVEMPRPVHLDQTADNELYKGNWIVNKVRDKIISSYFVQELFLSRAGG